MAPTIQSLFINPPIAVARLGGSTVPQDAYLWVESPDPRADGETAIVPTWSFTIRADGSAAVSMPTELVLRDGALIRPVCPFLEVWARVGEDGSDPATWREMPLTASLLAEQGADESRLTFIIDAHNLKAARRTKDPALGFGTHPAVEVRGDQHQPVALLATSPPDARPPMIPRNHTISLGSVQIIRSRPNPPGMTNEVDLDVIRLRFTPARGQFYGPPQAARLRIDAHGLQYLLADRRFRAPDAGALRLPRGDMVYPPGGDSFLLAEAVPARDGERVLDLCTGSGIQALAVAARAAQVVAIDIGARAAALARINMIVNGTTNVEVRQGDLFAPVRQERFDLLIANPPFVPAPQRGPAYHSGGPRGDRVLRRVVAGLGDHLRDGGRALIISHLALRRGETVAAAVAPWLRGFDGRVLALVLETGTPVDLAAAQALFALDDGFAAYAAEVRRWVAYLDRQRIEQVVLLLMAAERSGRRRSRWSKRFSAYSRCRCRSRRAR